MRDISFFQRILHLGDSWKVTSLDCDEETKTIRIRVEFVRGSQFLCQSCGRFSSSVYDHREREWRHLNIFEYRCYLVGDIPRITCSRCGEVRQVKIPWSEPYMRYTQSFMDYVLVLLTKMSIKEVEEVAGINWKTVESILECAVNRGLKRRDLSDITHIGVDEISRKRGHKYFTLVYDLLKERVIWVGKDRTKETLPEFFKFMGGERLERIKIVCCDMWDPYLHAISKYLPRATVVFDKFHVRKLINEAMDRVRRQEQRKLQEDNISLLKKTRYIFLKNPENLTERQEVTFDELQKHHLKTMKAYNLKELFKYIWDFSSVDSAREFFNKWFWKATHSQLEPMREVAHTLKRHVEGIISYADYQVTNSYVEGMNNKIKAIVHKAYGFRTTRCFKNAILFHCGKLNYSNLPTQMG